ncbi:class A beta-lactamase [Variovorax sp. J2L1-78]|uniref:class A beta-lactamase n=1 Tax=Variovorax arabinosiphilus TaxID=3053498 RepID=UPI002575C6DD|nr:MULTISPECIES: class A beta-lactamase [unclassified Variovorax]MDM0118506.1 class A beta-lactamase [Variovorax sp. J2L1-78]MDM0128931.1 class A beta-lactamase [Variovorax sp. J2L1-63]
MAATDPALKPFRAKVAQAKLNRIEADSGGRLGVCILDTATGRRLVHRAGERFPMCSTFKLLAAAMVLQRVDQGQERLDRPIAIERAVILPHSPATEPNVGGTMTMGALCEATLTQSDNAAANLMLTSFGGPAALTAYLRALGDPVTRLDRNEPGLNEAIAGDPRDTTTPAAMLGLVRKLVLGDALKPGSRVQLRDWLIANKTGGQKIRAGLPAGWQAGDKTGGGAFGTNNDVAIVWPPGRRPILVSAYLTQTTAPLAQRDAALAAVAALIPDFIGA